MKKILGLIISALIILSSTSFVLARAGGGEDFGGGGFDSGGSSSWDSDTDYSTTSSSGTSEGNPVVTLIVIIVIIIIISAARKKKGGTGLNIPASNSSMPPSDVDSGIAKLKEVDADFDVQRFKTHAKKVFFAVQEGWTKRDQSVCRPFMAQEVYQSHQMQIDNMKSQKIINVLKNIVVGGIDIVRVDIDPTFHKISTRVKAQMRDFKVKEDAPDKPISGEVNATEPFTEYWVFIRKSNLKTKVKDGIFDRKCPNCGAPIEVDVAGECKYCNANVVNGDYDWVLSEIIQSSQWKEE